MKIPRLLFLLWGVLLSTHGLAAEPTCPTSCNPACTPIYIPVLHSDQITVTTPSNTLLVGSMTWATCNISNCCSPSASCTLSFSQKSVPAGLWWQDSGGLSLAANLPMGITLLAGGQVSYNGNTTVVIPGQTVATCTLGKCQYSTLKVGPGYTSMIKTVQMTKFCTKNTGAGCGAAASCQFYAYQASITARYLSPEVLVTGTCSLPYAGCIQCSNPSQPAC